MMPSDYHECRAAIGDPGKSLFKWIDTDTKRFTIEGERWRRAPLV